MGIKVFARAGSSGLCMTEVCVGKGTVKNAFLLRINGDSESLLMVSQRGTFTQGLWTNGSHLSASCVSSKNMELWHWEL
jgi:hypothetical protein